MDPRVSTMASTSVKRDGQEELAGDILGRKSRKKGGRRECGVSGGGGGVGGGQREGESAGETL